MSDNKVYFFAIFTKLLHRLRLGLIISAELKTSNFFYNNRKNSFTSNCFCNTFLIENGQVFIKYGNYEIQRFRSSVNGTFHMLFPFKTNFLYTNFLFLISLNKKNKERELRQTAIKQFDFSSINVKEKV